MPNAARPSLAEKLGVVMKRPRFGFDRYSSIRTAYGPSFSPDGMSISFLSDIAGVPQVWVYFLEDGQIDQLTLFADRVSSAHFSPTDDLILFSMDPGGSENHQLWTLNTIDLAVQKISRQDDRIYNFGEFSPNGKEFCFASNERDPRFFDIYTQTLKTREIRPVYKSDETNYAVDWIGNRGIIFGRANTNLDNDLFLLSLDENGPLRLTPHDQEAVFLYCGHSPDGKTVYVTTNRDGEFTQPAAIDVGTGRLTFLEEEQWDAPGGKTSPDGRFLAYFRNMNGVSRLHVYDLENKRDLSVKGMPMGTVEAPLLTVYDLIAWDSDSHRFVFSFQGPKHNLNIWLCEPDLGSVRQLTFAPTAGITRESLIEPLSEKYPSFDGLEIPVLLYRPADQSGPLPTVVYVHGGPESQEKARLNIVIQYLANDGFLVLAPNVRGSLGYGKKWVHLDDVEKRLDSVKDLESLVKWAVGGGLSIADRVGIIGGSYGGFMVLSAITEFPDLWRAGVDIVGIANFATFIEKTAEWRRHLRSVEYGDPNLHAELFKRISPIHNADRIRADLLVIHGANDPRVPVQEAEQIVGRLKALGRHVEYVRFEDEGHGIAKIQNRITAYTTIGEFLKRSLLGP